DRRDYQRCRSPRPATTDRDEPAGPGKPRPDHHRPRRRRGKYLMHAENSHDLIAAAQRRHEETRSKAIQALRDLHRDSGPGTCPFGARKAEVSRSWLYTQSDICDEIHRLRNLRGNAASTPLSISQRSTDASLRGRLEVANQRVRDLTAENQRLRDQLAYALGR